MRMQKSARPYVASSNWLSAFFSLFLLDFHPKKNTLQK
jgi:hypothetical protein